MTTKTTTKAALYVRCSTASQDIDLQVDALRRYADQRGWRDVEIYSDQGVSGSKSRRPELDRLMADVGAGKIFVVACWKIDRLGRSLRHLLETMEEFRERGVDFVSVTEQLDTSSAAGKMVFGVIGCIAEYERSLIIERVRAGIAKAKASGKKLGRPPRVTEFQLVKARGLRAEGRSWRMISQAVGLPISTVRGALVAAAEIPAA